MVGFGLALGVFLTVFVAPVEGVTCGSVALGVEFVCFKELIVCEPLLDGLIVAVVTAVAVVAAAIVVATGAGIVVCNDELNDNELIGLAVVGFVVMSIICDGATGASMGAVTTAAIGGGSILIDSLSLCWSSKSELDENCSSSKFSLCNTCSNNVSLSR